MRRCGKLLIGLHVVVLVSVAFLYPAYAEPHVIDRLVFIHYKARGGGGDPATTPTDQATNYRYTGIHWFKLPVTYEVNPSGSGISDRGAVVTAITYAFEEWDKYTSKELFSNLVATTTLTGGYRDEHNVVSWAFMSDSNVIAITYVWYYVATKEIVECDTIFSTRFVWSLDPPSPSAMSVRNIATHEAGHWISLGDLNPYKDSLLTMYAYSTYGETIKETLGKGDVLGVQKAYGA